ncbi:MAG TPA: LEA type 2 family protein [Thermoanaerobaculia bacterium]
MIVSVLLLTLAVVGQAATPVATHEIHVQPWPDGVTAVLFGAPAGAAGGAFAGTLSLNGSSAEIPVSGTAQLSGERVAITFKLKYREIPEDWASRFRLADFDYRLRGRVAGTSPIDWSGTKRWDEVETEKSEGTTSADFIKLGSMQLTEFSLFQSAAKADVKVTNPLSFPLKLASTSYRLSANGREVGSGSTKGLILHASQETLLELPIEIDHTELLAAAGSAVSSGGEVEARLKGSLVIRLPGGDISVPLDLAGKFSLFK